MYTCRDTLANLWARGAGLQCCFSQERINLLVPAYHGSIGPDSIFNPSLLSVIVIQVKFKRDGDLNAELAISPLGVDRDLDEPLCYNTVRTPTLCKPDTSDRPYYFPFNLLNLATPLTTYAVRLVLLILVPLSSLLCYLYDAVLILTSDILYSLIDTFLSILRYISTHVLVVEP
jgi:hypothetical protein